MAPPRLKGTKVGLFSTRSPHRPNPIGLTLAKIVKIDGLKVHLQGLDLIDNTPILDIKPYIPNYDVPKVISENNSVSETTNVTENDIQVPEWIDNKAENLKVNFTPRALKDLQNIPMETSTLGDQEALKEAIEDVLRADPRSNYRRDKCSDRLYYFGVDKVNITAWFDEDIAEVLRIKLSETGDNK